MSSNKRYAGRQKFLGRGASGAINWMDEYKEKYGDEAFTEFLNKVPVINRAEISQAVTSLVHDDLYKDTLEGLNKQMKEDLRGVVDKGYSESTVAFPVADPETKNLQHWYTNRPINADTYRALNLIKESPDDYAVEVISSKNLNGKKTEQAIQALKEADEVVPVSISEADSKSPFIHARAYKLGKDGKTRERLEEGYKFRINPSMANAIARDYITAAGPNAIDLVSRLNESSNCTTNRICI